MRHRYNSPAVKLRLEGKQKKIQPTPVNPLTGIVYGLYATDNPTHIRYVGATIKKPSVRLTQHKLGYTSEKVHRWITETCNRGAGVRMKVLEEYTLTQLSEAESKWTQYYKKLYSDLLNNGIRPHHLHK